MPVVPDPAVDSIPRMEMSWLSGAYVTPGVNFATSANDLIALDVHLGGGEGADLSGTLLRLSSLRVAVTTISPDIGGAAGGRGRRLA